ncbi:hypothetical protein GCM10027174_25010 [Salinifilum aidingensis]
MVRQWQPYLVIAVCAVAALVASGVLPPQATRTLADVTGLVGAVAAAAAFGITGYRSGEAWRAWLSTAMALWAVGQAMWTWHRLNGRVITFPDIENIFYFGLPLCAFVALVSAARRERSLRREDVVSPRRVIALDALIIVCSLAVLLWELTLGSIFYGENSAALLLAVSYTFGDLVLIVVAILLAVTLHSVRRIPLAWIMLGLIAIGVSDAAYTYTISLGAEAAPASDIGYLSAPVFLLIAALVPDNPLPRLKPSLPLLFLPYVPLVAVIVIMVVGRTRETETNPVEMYLLGVVVGLVVLRQLVTLQQLYSVHLELHHQATHDDLTGVANRALVLEYLEAALSRASRGHYDVGLVYVDLDSFKEINDRFGHNVGDMLLRTCAQRLKQCTRETDLIGRIGGDEFLVILEPAGSPEKFKQRLADALGAPVALGQEAPQGIAASVGHVLAAGADTPLEALARADAAMYRDKAR